LITTARNRAIDQLRRQQVLAAKTTLLARDLGAGPQPPEALMDHAAIIPDERLELIFTCCHPALALGAQAALTLRTLGALSADEIALAFLVPSETMSKRLTRPSTRSATRASRRRVDRSPAARPAGGCPRRGLPDLQPGLLLQRAMTRRRAEAGVAILDRLDLDHYRYFHSTRASLLRRAGRHSEARHAYRRAPDLAQTEPEQRFLP
jgi:predicted RNA polymerase sigma factor